METMEEIVVTARKREESLVDVPLAITSISGDAIEDLGFSNLAETLGSAPSVNIIEFSPGRQTIQLRGISSFARGDSTVGFYIDELPFTSLGQPELLDVGTFDLDRIELLRGPQGTLFGASSLGGTVRILTRKPDFGNLGVKADVSWSDIKGGESGQNFKAAINVPVSDTFAFRIVGSYESRGGWIDDPSVGDEDFNDQEVINGRVKVRWTPTEHFELNLTGWLSRVESALTNHSTEDQLAPFQAGAAAFDFPIKPVDSDYEIYSATLEYDFGPATLLVAPAYAETESSLYRLFYADFGSVFQDDVESEILTVESRVTSNHEGPLRWSVGFFYSDTDQLDTSLFAWPAFGFPELSLAQLLESNSKSYAIFGEGSYAITNQFELTVGLRYFENERSQNDQDSLFVTVAALNSLGLDAYRKDKSNTVSPRFNLKWTPGENIVAYGNVARGFRPGRGNFGFQLQTAAINGYSAPQGIDPETMWSYEVGVKLSIGGAVEIEAAAFLNDWKDLQINVSIPAPVTGSANFTTNVGAAESKGIEFGLRWQTPVNGLSLSLSGSHTKTNILEGSDVIDLPGGILGQTGLNPGDRIQGIADETASASFQYARPFQLGTVSGNFVALGQWQYNSDRFFGSHHSDSLSTVTARIGYESDRWGIFLFGNNLTNENGAIGMDERFGYGVSEGYSVRPRPRQFGINITYN